ncbi:MAG: hypothetical protein PVF20_01650 [Desulfobacterales bacterium]|jgi:hypothetical protein
MKIYVDCYAGYRGEETPRRLWIGDRQVDVVEVVDRWLAPDHRYFKLLTDDRATMIIRHDTETAEWELSFFKEDGIEHHPNMSWYALSTNPLKKCPENRA